MRMITGMNPERTKELRGWFDDGLVREWRVAAGLSQVEAARLIPVADTTWRRWENGRQFPQGAHLDRAHQVISKWRKTYSAQSPELVGPTAPLPEK